MTGEKRPNRLTHLDHRGAARMVDVSQKKTTRRRAVAQADVMMTAPTWRTLISGNLAKGDALAVARLAGISGAKRTSELLPLCHPLPIDAISVEIATPSPGL